jgi:hypothetical protein
MEPKETCCRNAPLQECYWVFKNRKFYKLKKNSPWYPPQGWKEKKCKVCFSRNKMPAHWPRSGHFALHNSHCNEKGAAHKVLYTVWLQTTTWRNVRVEGPVNEPLSAQSRPDPRRVLCCFWCPNKTWTPPLGASDALKIFKNWLEMRKLPSPSPPPPK